MKIVKSFAVLLVSFFTVLNVHAQKFTQYVDPYIGSGRHGHVFVGANVPFGAVQLGPNNIYKGWDWCSGYHYSDSIIIGFSHTHLSGTGGADLGDVLIMPYTGKERVLRGEQNDYKKGYGSLFSHKNETVKPGYYAVKLDDSGIKAELTATERVGFHRYIFPKQEEAHIVIDLKEGIGDRATTTFIEQVDAYTFKGYRFSRGWARDQRLYFAIRSSVAINDFKVFNNDTLLKGKSDSGNAIKGLISFAKAPSKMQLKVGISPVSADNALANINAEVPGWDFDAVAKQADEKWNRELSKIKVQTHNETDKKIFYTALYHTMINPSLFNDHNKDYRGTDKKEYAAAAFDNYTVFSLWDTYRATHPLFNLVQPERAGNMIATMLAIYQQQGRLPIWHLEGCETQLMPGISGVQVVAEAYLKGIRGFDTALAWEAVKASTTRDELGLKYQKSLQYIPCNKVGEAVAKAMEYSISDGSVALMAARMGKADDALYYAKRSMNYRLYYDSVTKFFRGKRDDGSWNPVFNPVKSSHPYIDDLSEGNHWQYLWLVPQDVNGLMHLLGGEQAFITRLDSLFTIQAEYDPKAPPDIEGMIGQYAHGNEPGHHTTYLYAFAGQQWKTAEKVRQILKTMYHDQPDGVSGNEDCGQMSAWYVFSSLGFYPVFPASGNYIIGSPLFNEASIDVAGGKFVVEAVNNTPENKYVQHIELNGKPYTRSFISHQDIVKGGKMRVFMGSKPAYDFGKAPGDRPVSDAEKQ